MNAKKIALTVFLLNAALSVWFALDTAAYLPWADISKYLLMPLLAVYAACALPRHAPHKPLLFLGLLFYCGGDTLLTMVARSDLFFTLGLASFLVGHVFFVLYFLKSRFLSRHHLHVVWFALPLMYAAGYLWYLNGRLGDMLPFVVAYALALSAIAAAAMLRYGKTNSMSFTITLIGTLLFVGSDSMIGINRFHHPIAHADFLIMSTYISAVFLMVQGCLLHSSQKNQS